MAAKYISKSKAARRLQLSLHCFNRLCITKGIYPIEPKRRIKAQKGDSRFKTLYLLKDVKFLMHDPLMWTMRNEHVSNELVLFNFGKLFFCKMNIIIKDSVAILLLESMFQILHFILKQFQRLVKKLKTAKHLKSVTKIDIIKRNKPIYRLDQNVLERYPTFLDAVKDLADPLTMVFLVSQLGVLRPIEEREYIARQMDISCTKWVRLVKN